MEKFVLLLFGLILSLNEVRLEHTVGFEATVGVRAPEVRIDFGLVSDLFYTALKLV